MSNGFNASRGSTKRNKKKKSFNNSHEQTEECLDVIKEDQENTRLKLFKMLVKVCSKLQLRHMGANKGRRKIAQHLSQISIQEDSQNSKPIEVYLTYLLT